MRGDRLVAMGVMEAGGHGVHTESVVGLPTLRSLKCVANSGENDDQGHDVWILLTTFMAHPTF